MIMIKRIIEEIEKLDSFLITTHESPDGDAVGSSLALANYIAGLGKDVTVYLCDQVPDIYKFLPMADRVVHELPQRPFDVCFVLDVGEFQAVPDKQSAIAGPSANLSILIITSTATILGRLILWTLMPVPPVPLSIEFWRQPASTSTMMLLSAFIRQLLPIRARSAIPTPTLRPFS